jgi:glycosyltransferase involved in cell wall biosynthesis
MPELIENDCNGNLHDISDIDAWSGSMMKYLSRDEQQRQEHRNHIRPGIVNRYSWASIGQQYGKIYQRLFA